MRVIGGKFKGKKLIEPRDKETRPLKDLTKESIFNIINHSNKFSIDLKKAQVLDLIFWSWFIWYRMSFSRSKSCDIYREI
jgi:16S rRNA G966 N2-methylase RsmD